MGWTELSAKFYIQVVWLGNKKVNGMQFQSNTLKLPIQDYNLHYFIFYATAFYTLILNVVNGHYTRPVEY